MPTCCICNQELPRAAFSKSQLKRKDTRKCLECLAGHYSSQESNRDSEPFPNEQTSLPREVIDLLVTAFLEPNRLVKVPVDLRSSDALSHYFRQLFCQINSNNSWLVEPLVNGLIMGQTHINKRVPFPIYFEKMEPFPLLFWVVQWKHIRTRFNFGADEKLVALVLAAGADVNATTYGTKINAAFFAVKYASLNTLKLLADAGIDMHHRDSTGRTCFHNALERCDPSVIRYLLDKAGLDVMEQFLDIFGVVKSSASDHVLGRFSNQTVDGNEVVGAPISWQLIGPPPIEDIAETLILLRQRGAAFTDTSRYPWDCMGLAAKGEGDGVIHEPRLLAQLTTSILGLWLPSSIKKQIDEQCSQEQPQLPEITDIQDGEYCKLCLNTLQKEGKRGKRAIRLYCGHTFCQACLLEYGTRESNCPVCGLVLCKDVVGSKRNRDVVPGRVFGLRHLDDIKSLTEDQIIHEARSRKMYNLSVEQMKARIIEDYSKNGSTCAYIERLATPDNRDVTVELSATSSVASEKGERVIISPKNGPAMIDIMIKGIPVVAQLSNGSSYTCVSASVVKAFNLKKLKRLQSSQFRDAILGEKICNSTFTCLDNFCFSVGGIQVKLGNAVECKPDMDGAGVYLGSDFFCSARWCVADVRMSDKDEPGSFARVTRSGSWFVQDGDSSLRYYSHDNQIAHLPLLHLNPHKDRSIRIPIILLRLDTNFVECNWCCRIFPVGMLQCTPCKHAGIGSYYCDKCCQRAAWELHKITSDGHQ